MLEDAEGPTVLAVDESGLYWAAQVSADDATEALSVIRHLPAQGDYVDLTTVDGIVGGLTTHGSRLYWTVERRVGETRTNSVQSMSLLGGGAAISSFETHGGSAYGIAIRDDRAYWADFYTGVFTTTTASGLLSGDAHYLTGWTNARGVTVFDDTLFWTQMNLDNSVRFRSLSQPGKSQLIACGQSWPASVAVDQRRVYWINHYIYDAPAWIAVAERSGGSPRVLLDDRPIGYLASGSLTSDTDHLFWVERDTQIMRMLK